MAKKKKDETLESIAGIGAIGLGGAALSQGLGGIGGAAAASGQAGIAGAARFLPVAGKIVGAGMVFRSLKMLEPERKKKRKGGSLF